MELHLTSQQVKRIDAIFESSLPARRALRQELDALERQLDALLDSAAVDDSVAAALVTRVGNGACTQKHCAHDDAVSNPASAHR
jgi:hypothetical protein